MKSWMRKHQKSLTMVGGTFFVLLTIVIFFWNTKKEAVINETATIKSSEQYKTHSSNIIKRQPKKDLSVLTSTLHERQKEQSRIFLLVMLVLGLGLMGYSFLQPSQKGDD